MIRSSQFCEGEVGMWSRGYLSIYRDPLPDIAPDIGECDGKGNNSHIASRQWVFVDIPEKRDYLATSCVAKLSLLPAHSVPFLELWHEVVWWWGTAAMW
jgi:hypothetical protein